MKYMNSNMIRFTVIQNILKLKDSVISFNLLTILLSMHFILNDFKSYLSVNFSFFHGLPFSTLCN